MGICGIARKWARVESRCLLRPHPHPHPSPSPNYKVKVKISAHNDHPFDMNHGLTPSEALVFEREYAFDSVHVNRENNSKDYEID